jgi:glycosyltransferase involved in cell wall biosynthesis
MFIKALAAKMKKIVLFGASTIAATIIKCDSEIEVIAVADNDERKVGSFFYGVEIISPASIKSYQFEQLIITTGKRDEVLTQLTEELGVSADVIARPKRLLTKSLQSLTQERNYQLAASLLYRLTVPEAAGTLGVCVDLETLRQLGATGDLSPQTLLLQLSLPVENLTVYQGYVKRELDDLAQQLHLDWQLQPMTTVDGTLIGFHLDVNDQDQPYSTVHLLFRGYLKLDEYVIDLPGRAMYFVPSRLRQQTEVRRFKRLSCRVPLLWQDYLTFVFEQWQDERKRALCDYQHRGLTALPAEIQQKLKASAGWMWNEADSVSVVLVVYNNIDYLNDAIGSVLLQALPRKLTVFCVDDASSDGSGQLLAFYQHRFSDSVQLAISEVNQGNGKKSLLFNRPQVTSDFWMFLSGDDYWLSELNLWYQSDYLSRTPEAMACCCSTIKQIEQTGEETLIRPQFPRWNLLDLLLFNNKYRLYAHTSSILWRNVFYPKRGFFLPEKFELQDAFGDVMLAHFMLEAGGEMHRIEQGMNFYRYSGLGIWSSIDKNTQVEINRQIHNQLNRMMSFKYKFLYQLHQSRFVPQFLKQSIKGPINGWK